MQLADSSSLAIRSWQQSSHDAQAWLGRHCEQAPRPAGIRVVEGIVLWRQVPQWLPVALWPSQADGNALLALADEVREAGRGMVKQLDDDHLVIGYPIRDVTDGDVSEFSTTLLGAVALRLALPTEKAPGERPVQQALRTLMQRLEDGVAVLERDDLRCQHGVLQQRQAQLASHLELLAAVLAENRFQSAAMQLVTRLATALEAERVTLGWRRSTRTRVVQISHSAQFNRKMNRIRATEAAMDEALDQRAIVVLPELDERRRAILGHGSTVDRAHRTLADMTDLPALLSLPCLDDATPRGALTIERERPFDDDEIASLESLMALCTRALEEKRLNDRALPVKLLSASAEQFGRVIGVGHLGYKLAVILLVTGAAFAFLVPGVDRVAADATLESREQRVMAAPFRGYIEDTLVRPGDSVESGQPLATMDTRDLMLERLQWQSELAKYARQEQEMRAQGDRAALNIIAAQRDQAEARLALVESRLVRATLVAPFDGLVVSGDLTQRLGGAVELGEELFRVSPMDGYRLELEIPEGRIDDIVVGQRGQLVLAAMTGQRLPFEIERITPQTRSSEGTTRFVVEARLDEEHAALRPGMQGVGRIEVGEGRLLGIWTRELADWLRLAVWRWWG